MVIGKSNKMPTKGQFVAMWVYRNRLWSRTFNWNNDILEVFDVNANKFIICDTNPLDTEPEDNIEIIYHQFIGV